MAHATKSAGDIYSTVLTTLSHTRTGRERPRRLDEIVTTTPSHRPCLSHRRHLTRYCLLNLSERNQMRSNFSYSQVTSLDCTALHNKSDSEEYLVTTTALPTQRTGSNEPDWYSLFPSLVDPLDVNSREYMAARTASPDHSHVKIDVLSVCSPRPKNSRWSPSP